MDVSVTGAAGGRARPPWFWVAAGAAVLVERIGEAGLVADLMIDKSTLPLDQRTLALARPLWMGIAYGLATVTGLAGAILLLMHRRASEPLLAISAVAAAVTILEYLITPAGRDTIVSGDVAAAMIVVLLAAASWCLARRARARGWLR